MRWIVTRETPALQLQGNLQDVVCIPAIERHALPWPEWNPTDRSLLYMVTSGYVAQMLPADGVPVAALAPKTAELLGSRVVVKASGGALALASALKGSHWHIRYPTSDLADTRELKDMLGDHLEVRVVYATLCPAGLHEALNAAVRPGYGLYVASPSAVSNVLAQPLDPPARVVALGRTTRDRYEALRPNGFPAAVLVHDELAALKEMQ